MQLVKCASYVCFLFLAFVFENNYVMRREEVSEKLPAELNRPFSHQHLTKVILNSFLFPQCMAPWHVCVYRPKRQTENL